MVDVTGDTLFPTAHSPAGRLLGHLVSLQVPGTPIETSPHALSAGAGLDAEDSASALTQLEEDGFILVERGASAGDVGVTVLLAPPLEEFGISPRWGVPLAATPADGYQTHQEPAVSDRQGTTTAQGAGAAAEGGGERTVRPAARRRRPRDGGSEANAAGAAQAAIQPPAEPVPSPDTPGTTGAPSTPDETAPPPRARGRSAQTRAPAPAPEPAGTPATATATPATSPRPGRRAAGGAAVDETAVLRGFVERFEQLIGECDDWKRRATQAEERLATTEKLLRAAERRVEAAEARLASVEERNREFADLTRRMQQLARQADSARRPHR